MLELIADLELIAYFELIANLELIADLELITDLWNKSLALKRIIKICFHTKNQPDSSKHSRVRDIFRKSP